MGRHPLIISAVLTATGLALGLASGGGAQTVDGLDLAKVRERARLSPEDAEAFGKVIARRGDAVKAQAAASAAAARANAARHARTAAVSARPGDAFDFDAMVAAAGREAGSADDAPRLVAFASLSMPAASLRQMIDEVGRAGGVVVFRGFPGNSVKQFTGALARVVPAGGSNAVGIDPRLFRAFAVTTVPTYVVTSPRIARPGLVACFGTGVKCGPYSSTPLALVPRSGSGSTAKHRSSPWSSKHPSPARQPAMAGSGLTICRRTIDHVETRDQTYGID